MEPETIEIMHRVWSFVIFGVSTALGLCFVGAILIYFAKRRAMRG